MLQCPLLGLSGSCTFTSLGAQQRGSGDCFGVSSLCYDHSPRATKADHLLLPETTLSLVCTEPGRDLGSPSCPALSPRLALLHRWASLKGTRLSQGICEGKWLQLPCTDDFITLSAASQGLPPVCPGPGTGWDNGSGLSHLLGLHGQTGQRELGHQVCTY